MSFALISTPTFVITLHTTSSRPLSLTERDLPLILRNFCLKYWASSQHYLSRGINFSLKELLSVLIALKSDFKSSKLVFSFWTFSVRLLTFSFRLLFIVSILSSILTTSATKSVLLSLFKDSSVNVLS